MAVGAERQHGGNGGYDDEPDAYYSWDDTVPNHAAVSVGDRVALWDKETLLGVSVVEEISVESSKKELYRCPKCGSSKIKARKAKTPTFRCNSEQCQFEFDKPETQFVKVKTYTSRHDAAWFDLSGVISGAELRLMSIKGNKAPAPKSQLAIRALDWNLLAQTLHERGHGKAVAQIETRGPSIPGGHAIRKVRVRRGQGQFRNKLREKYGDACAMTGPSPKATLEAAHLYSYAKIGEHHDHGGLLLRRDIHSLFDRGDIAVHPGTGVLSVTEELLVFPTYAALQGQRIQVDLASAQRDWLKAHWKQHREPDTSKS